MKHTHSDRLERWIGSAAVEELSHSMRKFYWPIAVAGVPGEVYAMPGGDFVGTIEVGTEVSAKEIVRERIRKQRRQEQVKIRNHKISRSQSIQESKDQRAFSWSTVSDILASMTTNGKTQSLAFSKTGSTLSATRVGMDFWYVGPQPAAGANGAAAPGGTVHTSSNTGALPFVNPSTTNTAHYISAAVIANQTGSTLLLYDRLFSVAKTMSSSATEAVTGVPTRYQNTVVGNEDYVGGNFCYPVVNSTLPATAHNWTVCQYTNQAGSTGKSFGSGTGLSLGTNTLYNLDLGASAQFFLDLASGDVGVKALTQMQCSVATLTGGIDFVLAHPIAMMPCPLANMLCVCDGLYTAFSIQRIYDNACLSLMTISTQVATATTYQGTITLVNE
jgi:hypothetical protein